MNRVIFQSICCPEVEALILNDVKNVVGLVNLSQTCTAAQKILGNSFFKKYFFEAHPHLKDKMLVTLCRYYPDCWKMACVAFAHGVTPDVRLDLRKKSCRNFCLNVVTPHLYEQKKVESVDYAINKEKNEARSYQLAKASLRGAYNPEGCKEQEELERLKHDIILTDNFVLPTFKLFLPKSLELQKLEENFDQYYEEFEFNLNEKERLEDEAYEFMDEFMDEDNVDHKTLEASLDKVHSNVSSQCEYIQLFEFHRGCLRREFEHDCYLKGAEFLIQDAIDQQMLNQQPTFITLEKIRFFINSLGDDAQKRIWGDLYKHCAKEAEGICDFSKFLPDLQERVQKELPWALEPSCLWSVIASMEHIHKLGKEFL